MEKLFNARVSFKGEGSFRFMFKNIGEIEVISGRDVYFTNMSQEQVEDLRVLRACRLEHKLNADATGCYRIVNCGNSRLDTYTKKREESISKKLENEGVILKSDNDIILDKEEKAPEVVLEEPKVEESLVEKVTDEIIEESVIEEPIIEESVIEDLGNYVLTSTKHKGKTLNSLSKQAIRGNMKKFNKEDLAKVKEYIAK